MTNESKDWAKFKAEHEAKEQEENQNAEHVDNDSSEKPNEQEDKEPHIKGALEHPNYEELEDILIETEQRVEEHRNAAIRAKADLENFRRQAERDVERAHKFGNTKIIESLLPVLDSLEQALQLAIENEDPDMQEGLELTMKVFLDALAKHGVKQIDPHGQPFNPELHEAISMQPSEDANHNTILTVFQKGYELNGRVIRAARVIVAKNN